MDKTTDILLTALKTALAHPTEQPLFRVGKRAGLFPSRSGASAEAAQRAIRDGFLEKVCRDSNGKGDADWARITPNGVQFVYQHESPREVLQELVALMQPTRTGLPEWIEEMRSQFQALTNRFTELLEKQCYHLNQLALRSEMALNQLTNGKDGHTLSRWNGDLMDYLFQRKIAGASEECQLSELFRFLLQRHPDLSIASFHDALENLHQQKAVELIPFHGRLADLPEPEYAMLDGAKVYFALRSPSSHSRM